MLNSMHALKLTAVVTKLDTPSHCVHDTLRLLKDLLLHKVVITTCTCTMYDYEGYRNTHTDEKKILLCMPQVVTKGNTNAVSLEHRTGGNFKGN